MTLRARLLKLARSTQHKSSRYRTLNRIELNRGAMLDNVRVLQSVSPGRWIIPVLKGNAYGHGLREAAEILNGADCGMLAVDGYFEAGKIRHITRHRLLVLGYIDPQNSKLLDTRRCSFVVQDEAGIHAFGRLRRPVKIHMEINTGMNRLGLRPKEINGFLASLRRYPLLELEGIMSHLADADNDSDDSWTRGQSVLFDECVDQVCAQGFQPKYIHIAQTAGSVKATSNRANTVRSGIGLYGINPLSPRDVLYSALQPLRPVLELKSTVIKVIELEPHERVSYNGIYTAPYTMRVGILPLGYYEGVPRELSNAGVVTAGGFQLPIVGKICMNHTIVNLAGSDIHQGDEAVVISSDVRLPNSLARISVDHNLPSYAVLANVSGSIRRNII